MSYVLTLVASDIPLTTGHLARAQAYLDSHGIAPAGPSVWLSPHKAADIPLATRPHFEQMQALRLGMDDDHIDVLVSASNNRKKTLFFADMDSTIVTTETLDELAILAGVGDEVAAMTQKTMNGSMDFFDAIRARVALIKGLPEAKLKEILDNTPLSPGAEITLQVMKRKGVHSSLVSSGFTYFTAGIAARCGFDDHFGNVLEIENGALNGKVTEPILDKAAKLATVKAKAMEFGCDLNQTLAVGDGSNDIPMLQAAGIGIGYKPRPLVAETIDNLIIHTDLTTVLYVQGYTDADIRSVMN